MLHFSINCTKIIERLCLYAVKQYDCNRKRKIPSAPRFLSNFENEKELSYRVEIQKCLPLLLLLLLHLWMRLIMLVFKVPRVQFFFWFKTIQIFEKREKTKGASIWAIMSRIKKNRISIDIYSYLIGTSVTSDTGELGNCCSAEQDKKIA